MEAPAEARWRTLVDARRTALEKLRGPAAEGAAGDPWAVAAARFGPGSEATGDPVIEVMEPWLRPDRTLLDVGAGGGRHSVPLAARLDWVTAVEPSESMRAQLPEVPNLTVIAAGWDDADPAVADLVLCSHVLYQVPEVRIFLEKLAAHARVRVFVVLRGEPRHRLGDRLACAWGAELPPEPVMPDLLAVLDETGIRADVSTLPGRGTQHWPSVEGAIAETASFLGAAWRPEEGAAAVREMLVAAPDGWVDPGSAAFSQVAQWTPS